MEYQPLTTSVKVAWDGINVPGIIGYEVFYSAESESEESVTVSQYANSATIMHLSSNTMYQFQVATVGSLDEEVYLGRRSEGSVITIPEHECEGIS